MNNLPPDFDSLIEQLRQILATNINLRGRRVTGASASVDNRDYVTRGEILGILNVGGGVSSFETALNEARETFELPRHHLDHEVSGNDAINVSDLSGELADMQKPKLYYDTALGSFVVSQWVNI